MCNNRKTRRRREAQESQEDQEDQESQIQAEGGRCIAPNYIHIIYFSINKVSDVTSVGNKEDE